LSSSEADELYQIEYDLSYKQYLDKHDEAYDGRTNNLNNMRLLIARLQKKGSREAGTQTDEINQQEYMLEMEESTSIVDKIQSNKNSGHASNFLSMPSQFDHHRSTFTPTNHN